MNKFILSLILLLIAPNVYAVQICVDIDQEQHDALSVMTSTPEVWVQNAVNGKANKMIDRLVTKHSDKQANKLNKGQRKAIINGIDLAQERRERRGE